MNNLEVKGDISLKIFQAFRQINKTKQCYKMGLYFWTRIPKTDVSCLLLSQQNFIKYVKDIHLQITESIQITIYEYSL